MQRRQLLIGAVSAPLLAACGSSTTVQGFATISDALKAIEGLREGWRSSGTWPLPQVLQHLAQSVEYSLTGFPQPKSALFQNTAGAIAFRVFDARGKMSHSLSEPIPGAPALDDRVAVAAAVGRLSQSLNSFAAFTGRLAPHFAYGELDKTQYTRAHLMHLANHWSEFVRAS